MRHAYLFSMLLPLCAAAPLWPAVGVRVLMGVGDPAGLRWDGEVSAAGAKIAAIDPWRFDRGDRLTGPQAGR